MNQNMTPQRPPQQRPQGQPQRVPQRTPQSRPPQRPQGQPPRQPQRKPSKSPYSVAVIIALIVTVALLVLSIIGLCVALALSGGDGDSEGSGGGGGGSSVKPQTNQQTQVHQNTIKAKFLTLPSATAAGNSSYSVTTATDISGDTQIQSTAAVLIDVTNGKAVASKNGSEKVYPASMTKVMTLLVACENAKDPTALLTLTDEMVEKYKNSYEPPEEGPSLATNNWKAGVQVTVEDALFMAIYKSDTYACWLLADHIAGSESEFVKMMNDRAKALGIEETTHFENCTGLYHDNHYTTCLDMATIMAAAMKNPAAEKVLTSYNAYTVNFYVNGAKNSSISMYSGWYSARLEQYPYGAAAAYYAGNGSDIRLIAGKTGYETVPKYCFVTAGKNDETGTLFVCVQVGGSSPKESTDDTREIYQKYANY